MKINFKVFACYIFLHAALHTQARQLDHESTKSFEWAVFPLKDGRIRINITNVQLERMVVIIKNEDGGVIQKNFIDKESRKPAINYDISNLENGNYQIHLLTKTGSEIKDFQINSAKAQRRLLTVN